jgi:hypothetical protein
MVACTHPHLPPPPNGEHPVVAIVAVIAMIAAILLITWARVAVHGTADLEAAVTEQPEKPKPQNDREREVDEAVTANRFATGLSP